MSILWLWEQFSRGDGMHFGGNQMKNFDSRTYSINDFIEWDDRGQLEISPKFQRRSVWSPQAKSYLIDTIWLIHSFVVVATGFEVNYKFVATIWLQKSHGRFGKAEIRGLCGWKANYECALSQEIRVWLSSGNSTPPPHLIGNHIIANIKAGNPEIQETQLFPFLFTYHKYLVKLKVR